MYEAMSIAATGLQHQQMRLDVIANNVANVNTVAYKGTRLDFKDSLYSTGLVPGLPRSPEENQQKGHGVLLMHIGREFRPGSLQFTGEPMDFAIEGYDSFFSLIDGDGNILYTRRGDFRISYEGDASYIVNGNGNYILDENEQRIAIPLGANEVECDEDGTLRFIRGDEELGRAKFGIYKFRNVYGLAAAGDSNYEATPAAGERRVSDDAVIRQGSLEGANVDMAEEMTRIIRTQRAFQLASRALTTADEMEGVANNMRR